MNSLKMETPAFYRICVQGRVDAEWSDRLAGMRIIRSDATAGGATTVLEGRLLDQAALFGLLATLYDLHLPVLKVECLREN